MAEPVAIKNGWNGDIVVAVEDTGRVRLRVENATIGVNATVYLDGHQVSELVTALVEARIHLHDLRAMALPVPVLPRANELGAMES